MNPDDVKKINILSHAILHAEQEINNSIKRGAKGHANCPTAGRCYDQSGAEEVPGVSEAREVLMQKITTAFREYRKDLMKLFEQTLQGSLPCPTTKTKKRQ